MRKPPDCLSPAPHIEAVFKPASVLYLSRFRDHGREKGIEHLSRRQGSICGNKTSSMKPLHPFL